MSKTSTPHDRMWKGIAISTLMAIPLGCLYAIATIFYGFDLWLWLWFPSLPFFANFALQVFFPFPLYVALGAFLLLRGRPRMGMGVFVGGIIGCILMYIELLLIGGLLFMN